MIVKALLAFAGLRAAPPFIPVDVASALHSDAAHDTLNIKAAIMGGHARLLRLQRAGDRVTAEGNAEAAAAIATKQSEVRAGLDDLARRLD